MSLHKVIITRDDSFSFFMGNLFDYHFFNPYNGCCFFFFVFCVGLASPISYPKASGGVTSEDGVEAALRLVPQQIWPIFLW